MNSFKFLVIIVIIGIIPNILSTDQELCNKYNCPSSRRRSLWDNKCLYIKVYKTLNEDDGISCSYKQKSKGKALLLEFVVGFGIGHIYIENLGKALTKLIFQCVACYFICFIPTFHKANFLYKFAKVLQLFLGIAWAIW